MVDGGRVRGTILCGAFPWIPSEWVVGSLAPNTKALPVSSWPFSDSAQHLIMAGAPRATPQQTIAGV